MTAITDAQIESARSVSLLEYFKKTEPTILKPLGKRYVHANHNNFVIDNGKGGWYFNKMDEGGVSALDYLIRIKNMEFRQAVEELAGGNLFTRRTKNEQINLIHKTLEDKKIILPERAPNNDNAIKYLASRGLSEHTAKRAIASGLLYESTKNTCVFVGENAKYAYERGINNDIKRDALGSDKRFGFCIPANDRTSKVLAVFESPLDALAHYEICKLDDNKWDGYRLSLGGVGSTALDYFIEKNPDIKVIQLCFDNDKTGNDAATRITKQMIANKTAKGRTITSSFPPRGKDYLDFLKEIKNDQKTLRQPQHMKKRENNR